MSPEPDNHTVLARAAYQKVLAGEDWIAVLLWVAREAVRQERQRHPQEPFDPAETTPTIDIWANETRASRRPTAVPPPPPLPLGVPSEGRRTPTLRGSTSVPPEPPWPPSSRRRRQ